MSIKGFRNFLITEAARVALQERAEKNDVPVEVLAEVFDRGVVAWDESTQKTPEQYAFNRVDSFLAGGYAAKLDEDLLSELSPATMHSYIRKSKHVVDNTPEDWKSHKKAKDGIARATRLLDKKSLKEGTAFSDEKIRHPEHAKAYVQAFKTDDGRVGLKASNKHGNVKFFNAEHGSKAALKHAHLGHLVKEESEQLDELSKNTLTNYTIKASSNLQNHKAKMVAHLARGGRVGNEPEVRDKNFKIAHNAARKMHNRKDGIKRATTKLAQEDSNVVDNSGTELINERRLMDPARDISHNNRELRSADVRQKHNQREKDMYHTTRTKRVVGINFKQRSKHDHHLTNRQGHQLTDRWRDDGRERVARLRKAAKSKGISEGADYIEARQKLHDAHAESARFHAGAERDPELRRLDLHRAKRHKHASRVLEILKAKKDKK